jgi:hypothetical protein
MLILNHIVLKAGKKAFQPSGKLFEKSSAIFRAALKSLSLKRLISF